MKMLSQGLTIDHRRRRCLVLCSSTLLLIANCDVHGEPVTFRFNATIDSVFPGNPFDSGVTFTAGDVVYGRFTFEPNNGDGSSSITVPQHHSFVVSVNGLELASERYEITADDDDFVFDFEQAAILDQLEFAGDRISAFDEMADVNIDPSRSSFAMNLWADSPFMMGQVGVLEPALIPVSLETWNQLDAWRNLQLILRDGEGGLVGFSATVGNFLQIPEPSGAVLALSVVLGALLARSRLRTWNLIREEIC